MTLQNRYTMAVLVENVPGVLSQVARFFSRKGYNIESISAGPTEKEGETRITIELTCDEDQIDFLSNQLRKLIPVLSLKILAPENCIRRELMMCKVKAENSQLRNEIIQIANIFRANIIDVSNGTLTIATIGDESKNEAIEKILAEYEVLEIVRTGVAAIERGKDTINDETKEKGEFNYGKNVL